MRRSRHQRCGAWVVIVIVVFSASVMALAHFLSRLHGSYREQFAIERLDESESVLATAASVQWVPSWFAKWVPDSYQESLWTTEELQVSSLEGKVVDLSALESLPNLATLVLTDIPISDENVVQVNNLRQLKSLRLIRPTINERQLNLIRLSQPNVKICIEGP